MGIFKSVGVLALALAAASANAANYQPGEVIVKYKDGAVRTHAAMSALYDAAGVDSVRYYEGILENFEQLFLNESVSVKDAIRALQKNPAVEYAQPNYILSIPEAASEFQAEEPPPAVPGGFPCIPGMEIPGCDPNAKLPCIPGFDIPGCDPNAPMPCLIPGVPFPPGCDGSGGNPGEPGNPPSTRPELQDPPAEVNPPVADPNVSQAWGLEKTGALEAAREFGGTKDMIVAVIDTGVDYNHEDLAFNIWRNPNPTRGDVAGFDFIHNDGLPFDDQGHGSHTSGTVGAVGGNGKGVAGVAPRVSIMGLKFLSSEGSGTTADAIRAIDYAIEHGAKVLSNSWGGKGDEDNKALYDSIERAKAKDVLFIAAAGNDGTDNDGNDPSYPAAFDNDNLIAVAATDNKDAMAFFSNYGKVSTDLAAPGVNVYSTTPGGKYASFSGTSMACPHVAGAAALIWAKNPSWDYKKVKATLMCSVDKIPALASKTVTGGRLNVLRALRSTDCAGSSL